MDEKDVMNLANNILENEKKDMGSNTDNSDHISQEQTNNNITRKKREEKARIWTIVAYAEHYATVNELIDELTSRSLVGCISPLHDQDVNENGEIKKAHYHVMLIWDNPTTYSNVLDIAKELRCPIPKKVNVKEGLWRYFMHLDNPDKHQYSQADISYFGGCSEDDFSNAYKSNRQYLQEVLDYIIEHNIFYYDQLIDMLSMDESKGIMYVDYVANHTTTFEAYLKNRRYRKRDGCLYHRETGELID